MPVVIRHPARLDLFDTGEGRWGTLSEAKQFASEPAAKAACEPGDVVLPMPETQPTHPISTHP